MKFEELSINERIFHLRKRELKMTLEDFGHHIQMSKSFVSKMENGDRAVAERTIKIICHEFNVSESWIRNGDGEIFLQPDTFSFDEMAALHKLSDLEKAIMRGYMELDADVRKVIMAKVESIIAARAAQLKNEEDEIEAEVNAYRQELEAEKRAETSSASDVRKKKSS